MELYYAAKLNLFDEEAAKERGFNFLKDYHNALISNWNSKINEDDMITIFEDPSFYRYYLKSYVDEFVKKTNDIFSRLNGHKIIIRESPLKYIPNTILDKVYKDFYRVYDVTIASGITTILSIEEMPIELPAPYINICANLDYNYINSFCPDISSNNYIPWNSKDIINILKEKE